MNHTIDSSSQNSQKERESPLTVARYRILKDIVITIIDSKGQDKVDWLVSPGSGEIWFDDRDVIYKDYLTGKELTTINTQSFVEDLVQDQRLKKIPA